MDTALRQRLVGASVLIALAVVVLPMLLGGRPDDETSEAKKIELPAQPSSLDFETRRYPIGEQPSAPSPDRAETTAKPLPLPKTEPKVDPETYNSEQSESIAESPVEIEARPGVDALSDTEPAVIPKAEPEPAEPAIESIPAPMKLPATDDSGRYVVQVASFGASANANRLEKTLEGYGYTVTVDKVKSDVSTLYRVRVGPFGSEEDALDASRKIQSQVGDIKPRVMDLQPEKVSQVTKPSDPLVRWVVQVGSYSKADNAEKLVARLRLESLSAYQEEVSGSGSSIIHRVRVGPFLEREEAIRVDKLINERLDIDGVVMSAN